MQTLRNLLPGLSLVALLTAGAVLLAQAFGLARYGLSPLTLAIVFGAVCGNSLPQLTAGSRQAGLRFTQKTLLRTGVALYGFNLSLQQIAQVGTRGVGIDLIMVCSTLLVGWFVGTRLLGLDRETVLLTSAGSAFCGAAAVVATVPVLPAQDQGRVDQTATAVATVVLFGTLAMVLYPMLYAWSGASRSGFGLFIGSTVHEVAQVVAIGNLLGDEVARTAVIAKMIRVMLLVPFLLIASTFLRNQDGKRSTINVPWFALIFVACAGITSLSILPATLVQALSRLGMICLAAAMAALGLDTTVARLQRTGSRAFVLGLILFVHLIFGGALVNAWLAA